MSAGFEFRVHPERLAVARLARDAAWPEWARGDWVSVTRTPDELSIVCSETRVPPGVAHERGKVALGIAGIVPMTTIGVLASLCGALAEARVPVFVVSTFDTDWLIVSAERLADARAALERAGHRVSGDAPCA